MVAAAVDGGKVDALQGVFIRFSEGLQHGKPKDDQVLTKSAAPQVGANFADGLVIAVAGLRVVLAVAAVGAVVDASAALDVLVVGMGFVHTQARLVRAVVVVLVEGVKGAFGQQGLVEAAVPLHVARALARAPVAREVEVAVCHKGRPVVLHVPAPALLLHGHVSFCNRVIGGHLASARACDG